MILRSAHRSNVYVCSIGEHTVNYPPCKPRAEARPYKKYDTENLMGKITKMKKQTELQQSRLLLLKDKLYKHEREIAIRATQSTNNEENAD